MIDFKGSRTRINLQELTLSDRQGLINKERKSVRTIGSDSRKIVYKFRLYVLKSRWRRRKIRGSNPYLAVPIAADIFQAVRPSQRMLWIDILEGL